MFGRDMLFNINMLADWKTLSPRKQNLVDKANMLIIMNMKQLMCCHLKMEMESNESKRDSTTEFETNI
jgi:hypothetical protein